jgi:transcriptional regulator with XRE-family HTH domain
MGYLSIAVNIILAMRNKREFGKQKLRALLRELREEADLRQTDLAERLKRPQSFVSKYELGEKNLDFMELREVCQALGVSLGEFISRLEESINESRP